MYTQLYSVLSIVGVIHRLQSVAEYMYVTVKFAQTWGFGKLVAHIKFLDKLWDVCLFPDSGWCHQDGCGSLQCRVSQDCHEILTGVGGQWCLYSGGWGMSCDLVVWSAMNCMRYIFLRVGGQCCVGSGGWGMSCDLVIWSPMNCMGYSWEWEVS